MMIRSMLLVALVAAVLLFDTVGSANCGELCYNNGPCDNPGCSKCIVKMPGAAGSCGPGLPCGSPCDNDKDCNVLSGCDQCQGGVCTFNPRGCGANCTNNNDCADQICSHCADGLCAPGAPCGGYCVNDRDCNQFGSNCTYCLSSACHQACGNPCLNNNQCDPNTCPICDPSVAYTCQPKRASNEHLWTPIEKPHHKPAAEHKKHKQHIA